MRLIVKLTFIELEIMIRSSWGHTCQGGCLEGCSSSKDRASFPTNLMNQLSVVLVVLMVVQFHKYGSVSTTKELTYSNQKA